MNRADVHRLWAPDASPWTPWVKPILFSSLEEDVWPAADARPASSGLASEILTSLPEDGAMYRDSARPHGTAIVVDLPGTKSIDVGLGFVAHGFRPIPLFNGAPSELGVVDVKALAQRLVDGAPALSSCAADASPAFLLHADRLGRRFVKPGHFDNRSICRINDFPSATTLRGHGIRRVVVVARGELLPDLVMVLRRFAADGLELWRASDALGAAQARRLALRPAPVRDAFARWLQALAWHPRADGAFGHVVPQSS